MIQERVSPRRVLLLCELGSFLGGCAWGVESSEGVCSWGVESVMGMMLILALRGWIGEPRTRGERVKGRVDA